MEKIKIVFIGTDGIGSPLLETLAKGYFDLPLVVTSPDRPAGRKLQLQPSSIKLTAERLNLEIFQPLDINAEMSVKRLANLNPDLILVFAYGRILSREILDLPKIDSLNVHASLLPKYRGASPIQAALINRDKKTGISLMKMVQKMDAGPVYTYFELGIAEGDTTEGLSAKLAKLAAEEIPRALQAVIDGRLTARRQDEEKATYCGKVSKSDGEIDWSQSAADIVARIRAFDPWPGCFTFFEGKRLKILSAEAKTGDHTGTPGLVKREGVVCKAGLLHPTRLQPEGGSAQSFHDFINGHPNFIGSKL